MTKPIRANETRNARVIRVIETKTVVGLGVPSDPVREVTQYWGMDGHPLAKADEFLDCYNAEHDAELMEKAISEYEEKTQHRHM